MTGLPPKLIAIDHDDYVASYVGRTANDRQFFLTTPFSSTMGDEAGEFLALYVFESDGELADANVIALGPRRSLDLTVRERLRDELLATLGDVIFCRIEVAPFSVERFGTLFGLIVREPEDNDDVWAVEAQPGNYMAFFEPWDSGEYDS